MIAKINERLHNESSTLLFKEAEYLMSEAGDECDARLLFRRDVMKIPLLSSEEEDTLTKQFQSTKSRLVEALSRFPQFHESMKNKDKRRRKGLFDLDELGQFIEKIENIASRIRIKQEFVKAESNPELEIPSSSASDEKISGFSTFSSEQAEVQQLSEKIDWEPEELFSLLANVRQDFKKALSLRNKIVEANLRLVAQIAFRYHDMGLSSMDLMQEGSIGLMEAVERFDYKKGYKFSTYAWWWIRQRMRRAIANSGRTVRIPAYIVDRINKLKSIHAKLTEKLGRKPTQQEIAQSTDMSIKEIKEAYQHGGYAIQLDKSLDEEGTSSILDLFASEYQQPDSQAIEDISREELKTVLSTLTDRQAKVITLRFGLEDGTPMTLRRISEIMGISRERVRQIQENALQRLRHPTRRRILEELLE